MKRRSSPAALLVFATLAIPASVHFSVRPDRLDPAKSIKPHRQSPSINTPTTAALNPANGFNRSQNTPQTQHDRLGEALAALRTKGATPVDTRKILLDLRTYLGTLPPAEASGAIIQFLAQGSLDADTGLGFNIGPNGFLKDHPSLRVALIDWLGQIDIKAAGLLAGQILNSPTNADEWSVCLRNYARSKPTSDSFDFLRTKTEQLIRNPAWRNSPTAGYFEAFDVLVYSKATESTSLLVELVSDRTAAGRPVAHASFLTLDRLVLEEPAEMFRQFAALPELARARGPMVANMLARADLRDAGQRDLARNYLLDPNRSQQELEGFADAYPNANRSLSQNLLTGNKSPDPRDLIAHDRAALDVVDGWSKEPAFQKILSHLETMRHRLATFVGQVEK